MFDSKIQFEIAAIIIFILTLNACAAPVEEWNRTYSNVGKIFDVQQTLDGGYVLTGPKHSFDGGVFGYYLIKTDAYGNEQWNTKFANGISVYSIERTIDGGYILSGSKSILGDYGSKDVAFVIKTDAYGNEQWNRTFDENIEKFYLIRGGADSVQQTLDGGYILAEISSRDTYNYARVIKMDLDGNIEWTRKFEKTSLEGASVLQTLDNGYLLATTKVYENSPDFDSWIIKLDTNGNEMWSRIFNGKSWDVIHSIQLNNDGYILAGNTGSYGISDALLMKIDMNGNVVWSKIFAETNSSSFLSVQKTQDGGYILAGYTGADLGSDLMESFYGDAWLVKVDADGTKQWDVIFEEYWGMFFYTARQTQDGGYIIAGCCGWLAKLRSDNIAPPTDISIVEINQSKQFTPVPDNSSQKYIPSFQSLEAILSVVLLFLLKRKRIGTLWD